jgi:hypothetical protein
MMTKMRAKLKVTDVTRHSETCEQLKFCGVSASQYPADGSDENNSFARWSPSVALDISITNPALIGSFEIGDTFYVDFIPAD